MSIFNIGGVNWNLESSWKGKSCWETSSLYAYFDILNVLGDILWGEEKDLLLLGKKKQG